MKRTTLPVLLGLGLLAVGALFHQADGTPVAIANAEQPKPKPDAKPVDDSNLTPTQRLALAKLSGSDGADRAVSEAQDTARANVAKAESWVVLGHAWIRKARESNDPGFYLNADAAAEVVLEKLPDNRLALDIRGLVLMNGHKFEEARALAQSIVDKHADDPMAWGTLSDALLEMGRYEEATNAAQQMIDLKPNLPSYSRASYLQWIHGEITASKSTVKQAMDAGRAAKRDPEPGAWVWVQAATIFWNESDFEAAEAGADGALERISTFPAANVLKGRLAMSRGEPRRAVELFERAYKLSPLAETAWLLGDAKEMAGDKEGAEKAYAEVEKEGKSDPRTLALFYATKNRNIPEAVKLAEKEFEVRKDIYTEDVLAWSLYRAGRIKEAKQHIESARRLGTPEPRIVYHEGAIRIAAGEKEKGRQLVAKALDLNKYFDVTSVREASAMAMR